MLTLKNLLTKPSLTTVLPPSTAAPDATAKGKQLLRGRTKAKVEALTAELEGARLALVKAEQAAGDQLFEEMDTTAAIASMKEAGDRVRVLEAALAIARQKDETAQADLRNAEHQMKIQAEAAAIARARASAVEVERALDALAPAVTELASSLSEVKGLCGGDTVAVHQLGKTCDVFRSYMNRSCSAFIPEGKVYWPTLDVEKKQFSAWIDDLEYAVLARHRPAK